MAKCDTHQCDAEAAFRFTWPGRPEQCACPRCAARAVALAEFMGFYLEAHPLGSELPLATDVPKP